MNNNMASCLFPWCLPKSLAALEFGLSSSNDDENSAGRRRRRRRRRDQNKPSPLKVDGDGVLQVPRYRAIRREQSRLLQSCWEQDWNEVLLRCCSYPEEATHSTHHSKRTALHLATFNHACPPRVAQALLKANRHMVLVQDTNWYTPLHNVAFFSGESLVKVLCDTAIMVQQELQQTGLPPTSGTSPLWLASKRAAPLRTLRYLLATRQHKHTDWIAPSTGGEPYWKLETLDEYSSPLEILLRERAAKIWTHTILEKENLRLRQQMRNAAMQRLQTSSTSSTSSGDGDGDGDGTDAASARTAKLDSGIDENDDQTTGDELQALTLWIKCMELLAEHVPRIQESQYPAVVHCIASAKVPLPSLLQLALQVFPEQALQRDTATGCLPLHHVLQAKHPYTTQSLVSTLLDHAPQAAVVSCRSTLESVQEPGSEGNPHDIHAIHDTAHSTSAGTSTPLGLALELGLPLPVLKALLMADSHITLTTLDESSGLYPFAVAASKKYDLDVVYTLLNTHPQVLSHCRTK